MDGVLAQGQGLCNLLVGQPTGHEGEHLDLVVAQTRAAANRSGTNDAPH